MDGIIIDSIYNDCGCEKRQKKGGVENRLKVPLVTLVAVVDEVVVVVVVAGVVLVVVVVVALVVLVLFVSQNYWKTAPA